MDKSSPFARGKLILVVKTKHRFHGHIVPKGGEKELHFQRVIYISLISRCALISPLPLGQANLIFQHFAL